MGRGWARPWFRRGRTGGAGRLRGPASARTRGKADRLRYSATLGYWHPYPGCQNGNSGLLALAGNHLHPGSSLNPSCGWLQSRGEQDNTHLRPLFTIHAGEYVVGQYIEQTFGRRFNVWIPSIDTGVDLLVSDRSNRRTVSLQVKFSKDYTEPPLQERVRAFGWWSDLDSERMRTSPAELWVLAFLGFGSRREPSFVVVPPKELERRLRAIHGARTSFQSYLWAMASNRCWETRDLKRAQKEAVLSGTFDESPERDFTQWLDDWSPLTSALGENPAPRRKRARGALLP